MTTRRLDEIPPDSEEASMLLWALECVRIGNIAVRNAQEENRRLGIPNWYEIDGMLVSDQPSSPSTSQGSATLDDKQD